MGGFSGSHGVPARRGRHAAPSPVDPGRAGAEGPWQAPGAGINLFGWNIIGGLLYVGQGLPSAARNMVEPALIDPRLPVDTSAPDWAGEGLGYYPSYDTIPPATRAAYLAWLSDGRRYPRAPLGYVFLYFYGLERRVLHDLLQDPAAATYELPIIHEEIQRLLSVYGGHAAFREYAGRFERVLHLLSGNPPEPAAGTPPPLGLRAGLGMFAARETPVPADWALAWIRSHPDYRPRTPMTRCAAEFAALFRVRYGERHGDGLVVRPGRGEVPLGYRPASAGFHGLAEITLPGVPDVFTSPAATRRLATLADECTAELEAYSRYLGKAPGARESVQARALLPAELLDEESGAAGRALRWARERLGDREMALAPAEEFAALLTDTPPSPPSPPSPYGREGAGSPGGAAGAEPGDGGEPGGGGAGGAAASGGRAKPAKKDVIALAHLFSRVGIGMEPDPRLGGPVQAGGVMVLFADAGGPTAAPSDAYRAAALLLHLAAAVSAADGETSQAEQRHLSEHLERALHLTQGERRRLQAHLRWLIATDVKLSGLSKRVAAVDREQRALLGEFLAGVAAADGRIAPEEVASLTRIYRLLGLDPAEVEAALGAVAPKPRRSRSRRRDAAGPAAPGSPAPGSAAPGSEGPGSEGPGPEGSVPAGGPVVVRRASPEPGFALPRPPAGDPPLAGDGSRGLQSEGASAPGHEESDPAGPGAAAPELAAPGPAVPGPAVPGAAGPGLSPGAGADPGFGSGGPGSPGAAVRHRRGDSAAVPEGAGAPGDAAGAPVNGAFAVRRSRDLADAVAGALDPARPDPAEPGAEGRTSPDRSSPARTSHERTSQGRVGAEDAAAEDAAAPGGRGPEAGGLPAVRLDPAVIAAKLAETARVGNLLLEIFEEDARPASPAPPPPAAAAPVAGLDGGHSGLVRELARFGEVSRGEFEELAARWGLLPEGAIDRVNQAALDLRDEPLLEGDDPIRVNTELLGEMLR
ncbi:TerB N-terminal domain-containing protein [Bailinhaonella thermotolerans]|uniref:Tellurite resistance protein TerB n=1 Tax=Bailinhaonella thermotolerans TaxID=1070861 RepID=A0A3A4ARW7_9ACTN|nr:TerB N-terminal domain-containing protein [Bailinhaonella thermotolerans]RJL32608.1 hypothetical protein D5H75_13935 [Bailinhaonella thermotolerans]